MCRRAAKWRWYTVLALLVWIWPAFPAVAAPNATLLMNTGHTGKVICLALVRGKDLVLSGSEDRTVKLWQMSTGILLRTFSAHAGSVTALAVARDGKYFLSGSDDGTVRLRDIITGDVLTTFRQGREGTVTSVAFSLDEKNVFIGLDNGPSNDGIEVWTLDGVLSHFQSFSAGVTSIDVTPSGTLVAGERDGTVRLWKPGDDAFSKTLEGHSAQVISIDASPDGRLSVSAQMPDLQSLPENAPEKNSIKLWNNETGESIANFSGHSGSVNAVVFSPDGETVISAGSDATVRIWNTITGEEIGQLGQGTAEINALAIDEDGTWAVTGDENGLVRLWNIPDRALMLNFASSSAAINAISFSRKNELLAAGGADGAVRLWDLKAGKVLRAFPRANDAVTSVTFSDDNKMIAAGFVDGSVRLWSVVNGEVVKTLPPNETEAAGGLVGVRSIDISPDGKVLVAGQGDNTIRLWDLAGPTLLRTIEAGSFSIASVEFSNDGTTIISAGTAEMTAKLWSVQDGSLLKQFGKKNEEEEYYPAGVTSVTFAPSGTLIASTNSELNAVQIWDKKSGKPIRTIPSQGILPNVVAYSPDGNHILTGDEDGNLRVWNPADGRLEGIFTDAKGPIATASFSPSGEIIAAGNKGGSIELWNARSGGRVATLLGFAEMGEWAAFSGEGRFDLSSMDGALPLHWIVYADPLTPLAPEILMRDYYEPNLLGRMVACNRTAEENPSSCNEAFGLLRALGELNTIQPFVRITSVEPGDTPDIALVTVDVGPVTSSSTVNNRKRTEAYDLRLFRDGQIVGQWPEPQISTSDDLEGWRTAAHIDMAPGEQLATHVFRVQLPHRDQGKVVDFTAYAFNEDRVKSATSTYRGTRVVDGNRAPSNGYIVPVFGGSEKPRAYLVTLGVDEYENHGLNLKYAVADAKAIEASLSAISGYDVRRISLVSDGKINQATKDNVRAVIDLLAGRGDVKRDELRATLGVAVDKIAKVTPDDVVVFAFSGHGYTDRGHFYLVPSDSGNDPIGQSSIEKLISSEELTFWLRDVDAGEMVMIIDACHSAAGVPEGFKPGPMGDRGLGQLAYDKGMRILAATQASDVAIESGVVGHGLLTYALEEGLTRGPLGKALADTDGGKGVSMQEWLTYASRRVPSLYEDLLSGKTIRAKDAKPNPELLTDTTRHAQTPALFDFAREELITIGE